MTMNETQAESKHTPAAVEEMDNSREELLAALEELGIMWGDELCFCMIFSPDHHSQVCLNARAAIAKARGQQS